VSTQPDPALPRLLTSTEVARLLRVDAKTVGRWARAGKLPALRTLGGQRGQGHFRFRENDILALIGGQPDQPEEAA
jgi:excisionase family DNA binding protein